MSESEPDKKLKQYVNNDKFLKAMIAWKKQLKIAEHLSYRPNFMNYPFREEMVGDGIENCLLYAHNFNPRKSKNPFSYFTQIIYFAFLRRIEKEKKQAYIKYNYMKMHDEDGSLTKWIKDKDYEEYNEEYVFKLLSDQDIEKKESKSKKKTKKSKKKKKSKKNLFED